MIFSDFVEANNTNGFSAFRDRKTMTSIVVIEGKKFFKKQLTPEYRDSLRHKMMMYKEFEVGRHHTSPYIVQYTGINEDECGLFLLMEHINGVNITKKIIDDPAYFRNHRKTEKMLIQLLKALKSLHEKNVAYLDLKPENIMLTQVSNDVKLIDLGGCFTDSNDYTAERTQAYAAPELRDDQLGEVDARTDIFGVGMLLQYIEESTESRLPQRLSRIKERCLNEEKNKRFESVDEILNALNRRGQIIRSLLCLVAVIVTGMGVWQWYVTTESYRVHSLYFRSDAVIEGVFYAKTSEENRTCAVIGQTWSNLYIREKVEIDGQLYTTTEIADKACFDRTEIMSVSFPKSLRHIGEDAFFNCEKLVTATLPEGMSSLDFASFRQSGLRYVSIPESLKSIAHASFARCKNIESIVLPEGVESLELDAFADCVNLKSISLPSTLKAIDRGVFWNCRSLIEIRIPAGVETIGEYVFYNCPKLADIYNYAEEPQPLSVIFDRRDITLHVPAASVEEYRTAPQWKHLTIVGDL